MVPQVYGALDAANERRRLSSTLCSAPTAGFHTLAALPTNIRAIEAGLQFSNGVRPFVALVGPSGWGKTHLIESVASWMRRQGADVRATTALAWLADQQRGDSTAVLLLDDAQDAWRNPRSRHRLRQALERRVRLRRPTLVSFADDGSCEAALSRLPGHRDWLRATIGEPAPDERELVVRQIATMHGVTMAPGVARIVARHLHGNGRSIVGAVQRLRLVKADWSGPTDVAQAVGVLGPYLIGIDGWDPRDQVLDAVRAVLGAKGRHDLDADVTAYLLLTEVGLSEGEVGAFLGLSPNEAYARSARIRRTLSDSGTADLVAACRIAVLGEFDRA